MCKNWTDDILFYIYVGMSGPSLLIKYTDSMITYMTDNVVMYGFQM